MKVFVRIITLIVAAALLCAGACAEPADLTFEELLEQRQATNRLLIASESFEKLTLCQGEFSVGVDLPAGIYSFKGSVLTDLGFYPDESTVEPMAAYTVKQDEVIGGIELKDGNVIILNGAPIEVTIDGAEASSDGLTYEELTAQRDTLDGMLKAHPEYVEMQLEDGTYVVGQDIPAGSFCTGKALLCALAIYSGEVTDADHIKIMYLVTDTTPVEKFVLTEGQTVVIENQTPFPVPLDISTYLGLTF